MRDLTKALSEHLSFNGILGTAKELVQKYTHCVICGGHLHFRHYTDFSRNMTQEMAECPECGFKEKTTIHGLQ